VSGNAQRLNLSSRSCFCPYSISIRRSGFRTEQALPLRVGVAIDTSSSVNSRFRFEQAAASAFFHQAVKRDSDLGFVMGFENHPTVTQDFVGDPDLLSRGVDCSGLNSPFLAA
jgi:hypothetical protein